MPPLFEGSALYMPTALPGISIGQASQLMQEQDRIIRSFPEVESVFGSIGRSDSATDNAPLDMYDTTVMLKPREQWPRGMTQEKLISERTRSCISQALEYVDHAYREPPRHGVDGHQRRRWESRSRVRTLRASSNSAARCSRSLGALPEMRSIFAERVAEGFYINIEVNRAEAARYGLT